MQGPPGGWKPASKQLSVAAPRGWGWGRRRDLRHVLGVGSWHGCDIWFAFWKWSICSSSTAAAPARSGSSFAYRGLSHYGLTELRSPGQKVKVGGCEQANPPAAAFLRPLPPSWRAASRRWRAARPLPGSRRRAARGPQSGVGGQVAASGPSTLSAWLSVHCWWAPLSLGEPHSFVGPWGAPVEECPTPSSTAPAALAGAGPEAALQVSWFGGRFQPSAQWCGWPIPPLLSP